MNHRRACVGLLTAVLIAATLSGSADAQTAAPRSAGQPVTASAASASRPVPVPLRPAALMATVRRLASEEFAGRAAGTDGNALARAYVRERFAAAKLQPMFGDRYEQSFTFTPRARGGATAMPVAGTNLVGRCEGRRPELPVLVLSAHFDHLGVRGGQMHPGADDNASGVAVLLAVAEVCRTAPFDRTVIVAAFDAEENGLQGARAFVDAAVVPRERIALNVNLDMVARGDKGELYASGAFHSPRVKTLLTPVAARAPIRLLFGHDDPKTGRDDWTQQSDHGVFHTAGVPFVYVGVEDHPDYHRPSDTPDRIDADVFGKAALTILDALRALDAGWPVP